MTVTQSGDTSSENLSEQDSDPFAHWPHAAEHARRNFNPVQIEQHALRIIARGVRTHRLIAFVGAGASMAYGRLTWSGLMDALYNILEANPKADWSDAEKQQHQHAQETSKRLWGSRAAFRRENDHPVKAQILAEAFDARQRAREQFRLPAMQGKANVDTPQWSLHANGSSKRETDPGKLRLHDATMRSLENHHGYVRELARLLDVQGAADKIDELLKTDTNEPEQFGLRAAVERLLAQPTPPEKAEHKTKLLAEIAHTLEHQPRDDSSPLKHLVLNWGIRRFITTNYDREIERALGALGFRPGEGSEALDASRPAANRDDKAETSHQEPVYQTLNFERATTGDALAFAVDGSRRHAAVLHLHGDVASPDSLIITESDYQKLYLAEHVDRDLVTNATLANFAANPMIFVGSEVNEDDVLRPVRQFMTGPGHRSDRMAVAVFAGTRSEQERNMQAARLLVKYRVHVVHAGTAVDRPIGPAQKDRSQPNWLHQLSKASRSFRLAVDELEAYELMHKNKRSTDAMAFTASKARVTEALREFAAAWEQVDFSAKLIKLDGISLLDHPDLAPLWGKELTFVPAINALRGPKPGTMVPKLFFAMGPQARWLALLFEQWLNYVMSCCVCAKLLSMQHKIDALMMLEARLPLTFRKAVMLQAPYSESPAIQMDSRHRVCLSPTVVRGRFSKIHDTDFDEGVKDLVSAIEGKHGGHFARNQGRRLVVVCSARGAGKGGQFDHLLREGSNKLTPALHQVLKAMSKGVEQLGRRTVLHFNLSFADEVAGMVRHLCDAVDSSLPAAAEPGTQAKGSSDARESKDLLESLERALTKMRRLEPGARVVLILGNAGVLFDADGRAKNGLVHRVVQTLQATRFRSAPLDILMYLGESQMPRHLRLGGALAAQAVPGSTNNASQREHPIVDHRLRRRLERLNINQRFTVESGVMLHALQKTRVEHLAAAYFKDLYLLLGRNEPDKRDRLFRDLYLETGASRFAQTVILASMDGVDAPVGMDDKDAAAKGARKRLEAMINRLRGLASPSAVETTLEMVLDGWGRRFIVEDHPLKASMLPEVFKHSENITRKNTAEGRLNQARQQFCAAWDVITPKLLNLPPDSGRTFWQLSLEVMWHLSAFSHPVELPTLLCCERVATAVGLFISKAWPAGDAKRPSPLQVLMVTAECLTHWCLLFRIGRCALPAALEKAIERTGTFRYRYATHRHVQRHFVRQMGGRNMEATFWDQFTTTLYASQPDEFPALRQEAHRTLSAVVRKLTQYPEADALPASTMSSPGERSASRHDWRLMLEDADRIRAAYFLVRSTYSMGVVTHLAGEELDAGGNGGHLEQYRRMVRWIIHAANYWESCHGETRRWYWEPPKSGKGAGAARMQMGLFYPGELIWLYNECGVISLAQGKLHDAEQLLSQAEIATRELETDDTGSLHTRIRLHTALTHFERGRPHQARRVLEPIAARSQGHLVPPLIATFYLGLLSHVSGNYHQAGQLYDAALAGLQEQKRSRAAAFVLMNQADLLMRLSQRTQPSHAFTKAEEAISLAQQGGHEDLRHLAHLALVRLKVQARSYEGASLFETLNAAQRYAIGMDMPRIACEVHELRARLLYTQGEYMLSAAEATRSLEIAALYDLKLLKARGMLTLAKIHARRGHVAGARALLRAGKEIAVSADYYTCVRGFTTLELELGRTGTAGFSIGPSDAGSQRR